MKNQSSVIYFVLLEFSSNPYVKLYLFLIFFLIYAITLMGNILIVVVIRSNSHLRSPMYFFLSHLSFIDICFSSTTVPKLLLNFYTNKAISYNHCIAQMLFIMMMSGTELLILSAMAYDRYAAICKPLHYVQIMNRVCCRWLVGSAWLIGFVQAFANMLQALKLVFCGKNLIQHFSCELPSLLDISCGDTLPNTVTFFITCSMMTTTSFTVLLFSYVQIISLVLRMNSAEAKRKTFSTCSSHLIVVGLYYGTALFRYMRSKSVSSVVLDEFLSMQYSIATPMLNPIIYSLKTKEIKEAIKKLMRYKPLICHAV